MKHKLVWVDYEDGEQPYIGYKDEHARYAKIVNGPEMTLDMIADFCDQQAEGRNNHSMVGVHKTLSKILVKQYGLNEATKTIRTIAECGGLDQMNNS